MSVASEKGLLDFLLTQTCTREPIITMFDDGNLRAQWTNNDGEMVAIRFLGSGNVTYVLFARDRPGAAMKRLSGRDTIGKIIQHIDGLDIRRLMVMP